MASCLQAVSFDAADPGGLATFWAGLLGRDVVTEPGVATLPGDDTQIGLRLVAARAHPPDRPGPNRLHLHLTSASAEDQWRQVDAAQELGGRRLHWEQPGEDHVAVADPEGNEFCVIGPGNRFLAGCGHLGEVTCEGTRDVGLFWRDALGWPLVWDQDQETAVQSPLGGTKVSWGGPPVRPQDGRNAQRLHLAADDLAAEVDRLVALGARRVGDAVGGCELADVDGNVFWVGPSGRTGRVSPPPS